MIEPQKIFHCIIKFEALAGEKNYVRKLVSNNFNELFVNYVLIFFLSELLEIHYAVALQSLAPHLQKLRKIFSTISEISRKKLLDSISGQPD